MPKKMSDYLVFDMHKSRNTKLNILHQLEGKILKEYIEPSSNVDLESPQGKTYAFGLLKAARLTLRKKVHQFWTERLSKFRDMFIRYCHNEACEKDRYEEFAVNAAQPIGLQYLATNGERGMLCSNDLCSAMWLSTAGYTDYIYYGKCLEDNPLDAGMVEKCGMDFWKICGGWGGCLRENGPLINNQFPVLLRSNNTEKCIDCSDTATWCTQGACSVASLHPGRKRTDHRTTPLQHSFAGPDTCHFSTVVSNAVQHYIHKMQRSGKCCNLSMIRFIIESF